MSLLDKASLIVTPNAYKESKLYSVVPSSGAGDMTVVRATTATRINSAGLVEVVPRNLAQYSEEFNNGYWGKFNTTITANVTTAPNGNSTADKFVETTANNFHSMDSTFTTGTGIHTASIYAKIGERRYLRLNITEITPAVDHTALFDLQTGTLLSSGTGVTANIEAITNGWYRIRVTSPALVGGQVRMAVLMQTTTSSTPQSYTGDGTSGLFIWGAQLEQGSNVTEYFPTTNRLNIPRIDYTNGSCPSLLVEPQRTNLLTYSNDFADVSWAKYGTSIEANSIISPDGTQNASKLNVTTLNFCNIAKSGNLVSNKYTNSVFAKKGNKDWLIIFDLLGNGGTAWFNISNGTLGTVSNGTATIKSYGNGWYKCTYSNTANIINSAFIMSFVDSNNSTMPTSNGFSYIYGAQLEAGTYPTSYIPTVASSVTRNADVISKTGISSLIGQTEGTLFAEFNLNESFGDDLIVASIETYYTNSIQIKYNKSNNTLGGQFFNGSSYIGILNTTAYTSGTAKVAYVYKSGAFKLFINGTLISTSTNTYSAQTFTSLGINALWNELLINKAVIKSVQVYKTALIDSECINLTTL